MKTFRLFINSDRIEAGLGSCLLILSSLCFLVPVGWPRFSIALAGCLLTALWGSLFRHWKLSFQDGVALGCAAVFLLYYRWTDVSWTLAVKHGLSLFLIWTVVFVFRQLKGISDRGLLAAELILLTGVLFQAIWPDVHFQFMQQFGYDYWVKNSRGFSSFTGEPSALARIASGLLLIIFYQNKQKVWQKQAVVFCSVLLIFLSRSWTGALLLTLSVFCLCWVQPRNVLKVLPSILMAIAMAVFIPTPHAQSYSVVRQSTGRGLITDRSLMHRWYPVLMGMLHCIEQPFGNGSDQLRAADFTRLSLNHNVPQRMNLIFTVWESENNEKENLYFFCEKICQKNEGVTGRFIAVGLFRMGIIFLPCFTLFLWGLGLFRWRFFPVTVWLFACIALTSSVIMPVLWVVAGIVQTSNSLKNNERKMT